MAPNRWVVLLTPLVAAAAAFLTGKVAQWTGVLMDKELLTALMIAELGVVWKLADRWLDGWQKHELRTRTADLEARGRRHDDSW